MNKADKMKPLEVKISNIFFSKFEFTRGLEQLKILVKYMKIIEINIL